MLHCTANPTPSGEGTAVGASGSRGKGLGLQLDAGRWQAPCDASWLVLTVTARVDGRVVLVVQIRQVQIAEGFAFQLGVLKEAELGEQGQPHEPELQGGKQDNMDSQSHSKCASACSFVNGASKRLKSMIHHSLTKEGMAKIGYIQK